MTILKREDAIEKLARTDLRNMSQAERVEQLEVMTLEDWSDTLGWSELRPDVWSELEDTQEIAFESVSSRYDPVLMIWLRSRYDGATNDFLRDSLRQITPKVVDVTGEAQELLPCPCCGRRSLTELNSYDICRICWWEDDGQDNSRADVVMGGPNYGVSLTQGRANFLLHGISDPSRDDLRAIQDPKDKYAIGRTFVLSRDGSTVAEPSLGWVSREFVR